MTYESRLRQSAMRRHPPAVSVDDLRRELLAEEADRAILRQFLRTLAVILATIPPATFAIAISIAQ
jgi:hypothetical protein